MCVCADTFILCVVIARSNRDMGVLPFFQCTNISMLFLSFPFLSTITPRSCDPCNLNENSSHVNPIFGFLMVKTTRALQPESNSIDSSRSSSRPATQRWKVDNTIYPPIHPSGEDGTSCELSLVVVRRSSIRPCSST